MKQTIKNWFDKIATKKGIAFVILGLFLVFVLVPTFYITLGCQGQGQTASNNKLEIPPHLIEQYTTRPEESTYLTFSEWYIVYSAEEYAGHLKHNRPSGFSYFSAVGQFWSSYCEMTKITKANYGFNINNHIMLFVIGESFTLENTAKGVYENTVGRVFELFGRSTEEDLYAQKVNEEYAQFLHTVPWYEFPFHQKLAGVWTETGFFGWDFLRKLERKAVLSLEYGFKSIYGAVIKQATKSVLGQAELEIAAIVNPLPKSILDQEKRIKLVWTEQGKSLVILPRYEEFTDLVKSGKLNFQEIAGNDEILITVIAPSGWDNHLPETDIVLTQGILTSPELKRVGLKIPVKLLTQTVNKLSSEHVTIEHVYDY